jgi:hypothetical protein
VKKSLLLIAASFRSLRRWARQHIYAWLILAPVVLGITYFTIIRLSYNLPDWRPSSLQAITLASVFTLSLIGLSLSRAISELYHPRRPESYFDSLPVSSSSHFHAALAIRISRTVAVVLAVLITRAGFTDHQLVELPDIAPAILFVLITSLAEILGALLWIHFGYTRNLLTPLLGLPSQIANATIGGFSLAALTGRSKYFQSAPWSAVMAGWILALYFVVHFLNSRWRSTDIEHARRLESASRSSPPIARILRKKLPRPVAAQLERDLRLTLRAFSSAVYVVVALVILLLIALSAALSSGWIPSGLRYPAWLDATWAPPVIATKVTCAFALAALSSVIPVLIAYELPHMWLERAAGTTGLDLLRSKIWYSRILTFVTPLVVWGAGALTGTIPFSYIFPLLAECLWLWWLMSSLMGALSFEMPTRPDLAIIVNGTIGLAIGLLSAMVWPLGLILYPQAMHSLTQRGRQRARYYLITESE